MANHESSTSETTDGTDPQTVDAVAVTVEDVVAALEANRTADRGAVLRITPPFAGRMRARLHVDGEQRYDGESQPIHLDPERLVEAVPAYPTADETADPESHRRRHTDRINEWRETVRERLREAVTVDHSGETLEFRLLQLG